nr:LysE/ArgO family amino acid transporter [Paenibacillus pinistramenti]
MLAALMHGFVLAFGLILPLGVQNVFIFNQGAVHKRFIYALPAVLTAAICDMLLITAAVAGVSIVLLGSVWFKTLLLAAGTVFLLFMGWQTWKNSGSSADSKRGEKEADRNSRADEPFSPRRQILFAASVSLLNPHAILDTIGVIGTGSLRYAGMDKIAYAAACILVSWLWFAGLAYAGRRAGQLDRSGRLMEIVSKISAVIIWAAALYMGSTLLLSE